MALDGRRLREHITQREVDRTRGRKREPEHACGHGLERHGVLFGRAAGHRRNLPESTAVVARLEVGARWRRPEGPLEASVRDRRAANRLRARELELNPCRRAIRRHGQRECLRVVAVHETRGLDRAGARGDDRLQDHEGHIARGRAERHDGNILIVLGLTGRRLSRQCGYHIDTRSILERSGRRRRRRQRCGEWAAPLDHGLGPHQLLHRLRRRDPRASRLAPSRRARDGLLETETVGELRRVAKGLLPLGSHVHQPLVDHLVAPECRIEALKASEADARHPLEIASNALLGDVAVHPMPPDARTRGRGRVLEPPLEGVSGWLSIEPAHTLQAVAGKSEQCDETDQGKAVRRTRHEILVVQGREAVARDRRTPTREPTGLRSMLAAQNKSFTPN